MTMTMALPQGSPHLSEAQKTALVTCMRQEGQLADAKLRSMSGSDQADSEVHYCVRRVYEAVWRGDTLESALAVEDKRWRAYAAEQERKVNAAPKLRRGPSSGHSSMGHRWVSPTLFEQKEPHIRAMVRYALTSTGPFSSLAPAAGSAPARKKSYSELVVGQGAGRPAGRFSHPGSGTPRDPSWPAFDPATVGRVITPKSRRASDEALWSLDAIEARSQRDYDAKREAAREAKRRAASAALEKRTTLSPGRSKELEKKLERHVAATAKKASSYARLPAGRNHQHGPGKTPCPKCGV